MFLDSMIFLQFLRYTLLPCFKIETSSVLCDASKVVRTRYLQQHLLILRLELTSSSYVLLY